ncbi:MAG: SRPBCC domain-containing protein [Gemmatimonadaceae bacterium]|nr:SRPBCC domain-containing protein [Gemmatimonadaceae bacterium]
MIEFSVDLNSTREHAFDLFTLRISDWWPPDHRPSKNPASRISLSESGTFVERTPDGEEIPLGHVHRWDRPSRLQLDFYLGTNPAQPTRVDVLFEETATGTRIVVQHRPLAASNDLWATRVSRFQASWPALLQALGRQAGLN